MNAAVPDSVASLPPTSLKPREDARSPRFWRGVSQAFERSRMRPDRMAVASPRGISSLRGAKRGDAVDVVGGAPEACYVQVSVNNVLRYRGDRGEQLYNIDLLDPATIEGIEFYTSSQLPAEFNRNSTGNCGALLIWLKP